MSRGCGEEGARGSAFGRARVLAPIFVGKFNFATVRRSLYPYAVVLASRTSVTLQQFSIVLMLMQIGFGCCPMLVPALKGQFSARSVLCGAVSIHAACLGVIALGTNFSTVAVATVLMGSMKGLFDPIGQAAVTDFVDAEFRTQTSALMEVSWGCSSLVGMPLFGVLLDKGWAVTWLTFGGVSVFVLVFILAVFPKAAAAAAGATAAGATTATTAAGNRLKLGELREVFVTHRLSAVCLGSLVLCAADSAMLIGFGAWMANEHGMSLQHMALGTLAIGVGDTVAEMTVARVGGPGKTYSKSPEKLMWRGLVAAAVSYFALVAVTTFTTSLIAGVAVYVVCIFFFEVAVCLGVAASSTLERASAGSGAVESVNFAFHGVGRAVGSIAAAPLYTAGGFPLVAAAAAAAAFVAALNLWLSQAQTGGRPEPEVEVVLDVVPTEAASAKALT